MQSNFNIPLDVYYEQVFAAAEETDAAMLAPWYLAPYHTPLGRSSP